MPGLVKIGFSLKVPTERALELSTTGVPMPFDVEYYCLVEDPAALEIAAHQALSAQRQSADREFFRMSVRDAIAAIKGLGRQAEHAWQRTPDAPPAARTRPERVPCSDCGATYVIAEYCPRCRVKLVW